jgi:hypothetical protein
MRTFSELFMRALPRLSLLVLIVGTSRCGGSTESHVTAPDTIDLDLVGTYQMVSLNGSSPPVTIGQGPDYRVEVVDEITTLNADGTYLDVTIVRETNGEVATDHTFECPGTFAGSKTSLRFVDGVSNGFCGATFSGKIEGETLTLVFGPSWVSVLRR